MKQTLIKVRNANFKDMKNHVEGKGVKQLHEIENVMLEDTNLYQTLENLSIKQLKEISCYMLAGRELSRYYGTTRAIKLKEYVEYYRETFEMNKKEELIEYICSKSKLLNNYIDTTLRFL